MRACVCACVYLTVNLCLGRPINHSIPGPQWQLGSLLHLLHCHCFFSLLACPTSMSAKAPHGCCNADTRKYSRTTSAGGTTTVATPAPHSAATALAGAAATKGPAPTALVQTSALSASLADTLAQPPSSPGDPSGAAALQPQPQPRRVSNTPPPLSPRLLSPPSSPPPMAVIYLQVLCCAILL